MLAYLRLIRSIFCWYPFIHLGRERLPEEVRRQIQPCGPEPCSSDGRSVLLTSTPVGGDRGENPRGNRGGKCTGSGKRRGGKWESEVAERGKTLRMEIKKAKETGTEIKGYGKWDVLDSPSPLSPSLTAPPKIREGHEGFNGINVNHPVANCRQKSVIYTKLTINGSSYVIGSDCSYYDITVK